ncbi:hypothetical protein FRC07_004530, partial [Ceratobasidium sp. 392]
TELVDKAAERIRQLSLDSENERLKGGTSEYEALLRSRLSATMAQLNGTRGTGISRLLKARETLETLEHANEEVTNSVQDYLLSSTRSHSEALHGLEGDTIALETRVSQNEQEISLIHQALGSIKGLCRQASEALESLAVPDAWLRGLQHRAAGWSNDLFGFENVSTLHQVKNTTHTPFQAQTRAFEVLSRCFQGIASSIPIHAWSKRCDPAAVVI